MRVRKRAGLTLPAMSSALTIREIVASEWIDRAWPLLAEHREELATNKALMQLNPARESYQALEAVDQLLTLGMFEGDELVGYSVNVIAQNLHYADVRVCQNDLLFLRADLRNGRNGLALLGETVQRAHERGCSLMLWHAKPDTALAKMLPKLGYQVQDVVYSKELA